jgi:hypothetical protein
VVHGGFFIVVSIALLLRVAKILPDSEFLRFSFGHFLHLSGFQDERAAVSEVNFWSLPGLFVGFVGALVREFEGVSSRGFVVVGDPTACGRTA